MKNFNSSQNLKKERKKGLVSENFNFKTSRRIFGEENFFFYLDIGRMDSGREKDSISRYEGTLSLTVIRGNSNYTVITVLTIMVARAVNINDTSDRADADGDNSWHRNFYTHELFRRRSD